MTTQVIDRTLPYSLDAERATLGAVLISPSLWPEAASIVSSAEFFRDAHRRIWEAMVRLHEAGITPDFVTLKNELARTGELEEVGGPVYIASLVDGVPRSTNVADYAGIVREKAALRALVAAGNQVCQAAYEAEMSAAVIAEMGAQGLQAAAGQAIGGPVGLGDAVGAFVRSLEDPESTGTIPTKLADVDAALAGGLRRGQLCILAARPSVGKTAMALGIGLHTGLAGTSTAVFSLEMSTEELAGRAAAWEARVSGHRLRSRTMLTEQIYGKISVAWSRLSGASLVILTNAVTLPQVDAWVQRLKQREEGLTLVIVDYLQLLVHGSPESQVNAVSAISRGLKRIAIAHDVAVLALSQLSRAPEGRKDKRPQLSDLRDSGALEQDADVTLLLYREEMHAPSDSNAGIAEVIIAKQRNGPTGVHRVVWLAEYMRFEDLAKEYA